MSGAQLQQALELFQRGKIDEAWRICEPITHPLPDDFETLNVIGTIALQAGQIARGVEALTKAIAQNPDNARTHGNLGFGLRVLGHLDEALTHYDRAIALKPSLADAHNGRGVILSEQKRPVDALASYDQAIAANPNSAEAFLNRGTVLQQLGRAPEALGSFDRAIELAPHNAKAHLARGLLLKHMKRLEEAIASSDKAIALVPDLAAAHSNRAAALIDLRRFDDALAAYDRSIALTPNSAALHVDRAETLRSLNRSEEALAGYDRALELDPDAPLVEGTRLHMKMKICDWRGYDADLAHLVEKIRHGNRAAVPLALFPAVDDPAAHRQCAEILARYMAPKPAPRISAYARHAKIRVGYFLSNFDDQVVARLMRGCFESHDTKQFEIIGFRLSSDGVAGQPPPKGFEHFIDVAGMSDVDVAALAREREIDIAVDLMGFTFDGRPQIFALGAAPLQINYLGDGATLGASYIDYIMADQTLIGEADRQYYVEKIITLPYSYMPPNAYRKVARRSFSSAELGLPKDGFVFCCFNNNHKITPEIFDSWMRILRQVEGSILWLLQDNADAASNLKAAAIAKGINPARLIFAARIPSFPEHLARLRCADLFLDTMPYNACATANDTLWAGLPVLTITGRTFTSRVGASLLNAIDVPDLVTNSREQYEAHAVFLATHPEALKELREKLSRNRHTAPLFDHVRHTRFLEAAYKTIYERQQAGLPPDHIAIAPEQDVGK